MPLDRSKSEDALRSNISELIRSYKRTGRIGNTKPSTIAKARKMALAAAYSVRERAEK